VDRDRARIEACLRRLLPYCETARVTVTGGVAVEYHLASRKRSALRARFSDLDLIAAEIEAISPAVRGDFLISHYHRAGPAVPKAMLQLVDPESRLRIDVFPDLDDATANAAWATIGNTTVRVLDADAVVRHKLRTIGKASPSSPVDPKHWFDVIALDESLQAALPPPHAPVFRPEVFSTDLDAVCPRCAASRRNDLALAPKAEIYAILGYV